MGRVLINSNIGLFYSNFFILTPTFPKVPIEPYGKTPNFSSRQHFYSYFQNPSENSACVNHFKSIPYPLPHRDAFNVCENKADPDQTALVRATWSGSALFAYGNMNQGPNLRIFCHKQNLACYKKIYWLNESQQDFFKNPKGYSWENYLGRDGTFLNFHRLLFSRKREGPTGNNQLSSLWTPP